MKDTINFNFVILNEIQNCQRSELFAEAQIQLLILLNATNWCVNKVPNTNGRKLILHQIIMLIDTLY